jgi:hypothetical protein
MLIGPSPLSTLASRNNRIRSAVAVRREAVSFPILRTNSSGGVACR